MKNIVIYIIIFLATFIVVTSVIFYLNSSYTNIFRFDFTHAASPVEENSILQNDSFANFEYIKNYFENEFKKTIIDSIKANTLVKVDTVFQETLQDQSLLDSLNMLKSEISYLTSQKPVLDTSSTKNSSENKISEDWANKTAKLIESMSPKNAAKVIQKYSDNEARELIYRMKKNKAAAILSLLDPNFVNRITKSQI